MTSPKPEKHMVFHINEPVASPEDSPSNLYILNILVCIDSAPAPGRSAFVRGLIYRRTRNTVDLNPFLQKRSDRLPLNS